MPLITEDRVLEASTTTGTGDFTLAGAVTGYRAFSAVCATSDLIYYAIEGVDASGIPTGEWETGLGTYSAANTLTRTTVIASSNAGAAVNFSAGSKRVTISFVASQHKFRGALAYKTADETTANYTTSTAIPWTNELYDTGAHHDSVTNNSRLTAGAGVNKVDLHAHVSITSGNSTDYVSLRLNKNGAAAVGLPFIRAEGGSASTGMQVSAFGIPIAASTDYFEVLLDMEADSSITIAANRSSFSMRVVD